MICASQSQSHPLIIMTNSESIALPKDGLAGLKENWKTDATSGFILFLIALPLSLGIAMASGVPPLSGVFAAIIGGMVVSMAGGSYVTINGPAAGLIVVILGSVERLGGGDAGYHATIAAVIISGIFLILLGLLKAGELGLFAPTSAVHGMLAAIGLIIIAKQLPILLGIKPPSKEPLVLFQHVPDMLMNLNPAIAVVGFVSLAILIAHNLIKNKAIKKVPAPIIVVIVSLFLSQLLGLNQAHAYTFMGHEFSIDPKKCLVVIPSNPLEAIAFPDFSKTSTGPFWFSVLSITLVQGIETLLTVAAVDKLDPFKRKSNWSRDVAAVGFASVISGAIGGISMIAEIVRSTANIGAGARTRWSNFFHGFFMLVFLLVGANLIQMIPLTALAALLVFTGYRLASPKVFKHTWEVGKEQMLIFLVTIYATLAVDLLVGVGTGILTKFILHILRGAPITKLFSAGVNTTESGDTITVEAKGAAIFSNYICLKRKLDKLPRGKKVILDLSQTKLVDHTVMDHLHTYSGEYTKGGGDFKISGLGSHTPTSSHPLAARRLLA